jgi:hypothetical protein
MIDISLLRLDKNRRESIADAEKARAEQIATNYEMSQLTKGSREFVSKVAEMKQLSTKTWKKLPSFDAFLKFFLSDKILANKDSIIWHLLSFTSFEYQRE